MPSTTAPGVRIIRMVGSPSFPSNVLKMPVSCKRPTQARVRSKKLMHMGSITSIYRNFWAVVPQWAM